MSQADIKKLETEIFELTKKLGALKKDAVGEEISDYTFESENGSTQLSDMFGDKDKLLLIHNMGQGCRYCTTWADGLNGFLPHLESVFSVALVSKDAPELQRRFANERGWRFRTFSHGGGKYLEEQSVGEGNSPGAVFYEKKDGKIFRKNAVGFGPYDLYCSIWNFLALGGYGVENFTPQYNYWKRPEKMCDGGENLR